jgi:hypothetical protein
MWHRTILWLWTVAIVTRFLFENVLKLRSRFHRVVVLIAICEASVDRFALRAIPVKRYNLTNDTGAIQHVVALYNARGLRFLLTRRQLGLDAMADGLPVF